MRNRIPRPNFEPALDGQKQVDVVIHDAVAVLLCATGEEMAVEGELFRGHNLDANPEGTSRSAVNWGKWSGHGGLNSPIGDFPCWESIKGIQSHFQQADHDGDICGDLQSMAFGGRTKRRGSALCHPYPLIYSPAIS